MEDLIIIAKLNKVDLTGDSQHGFKQERSTVTAAAAIQSMISRALDENKMQTPLSTFYVNTIQ